MDLMLLLPGSASLFGLSAGCVRKLTRPLPEAKESLLAM